MELSKELKEEVQNTELIMNTRIELDKLLKTFLDKKKEDGKPYCLRCIKQDFEIGEYDPNDTAKYYELVKNEDKSRIATRQTKNGLKICQPHIHYDCPRGHGVIIPNDYWTEAPTVKAPEEKPREQKLKETEVTEVKSKGKKSNKSNEVSEL